MPVIPGGGGSPVPVIAKAEGGGGGGQCHGLGPPLANFCVCVCVGWHRRLKTGMKVE